MKLSMLLFFPVPLIVLFLFEPWQYSSVIRSRATFLIRSDSIQKKQVDDFKLFRDAIYKEDKAAVKAFFTFPVLNPANEIWFLVLSEKQREQKKLTGKMAPFNEKDFNRYYKKLFPDAFKKTILKIRSAELFNKGETESTEIKEGDTTTKMYASIDKEKNMLSLNLSYTVVWREDNGEVSDGGESTVIYNFKILPNGHLRFMHVRLAG